MAVISAMKLFDEPEKTFLEIDGRFQKSKILTSLAYRLWQMLILYLAQRDYVLLERHLEMLLTLCGQVGYGVSKRLQHLAEYNHLEAEIQYQRSLK